MDKKLIDVLELRRTAKEVKRHVIVMRVLALLAIILILIIAVAYAISYFYDKLGSFTVKVNKYDMVHQGLTLSETVRSDIPHNSAISATLLYSTVSPP